MAPKITKDNGLGYDLARRAGVVETINMMYNELRAQSFIICAATYAGPSSEPLSRDMLYPALRLLIAQHFALRVIAVVEPSEQNSGRHVLWEGQLYKIDLDRVVEFIDAKNGDKLRSVIEDTHNEWLDLEDHEVPMWRLKVVNGRHLVWAFSHVIADGMSGYAFHRHLLQLLNEQPQPKDQGTSVFEPPPVKAPELWHKDWPGKISWLLLIWDVLFMYFIRTFFTRDIMFSDAAVDFKPVLWSERGNRKVSCRTRVYTLRIPSELQKEILAACRRHKVTFSTLLHTVSVMTAATDLYPKAKYGLANMAISLRPYTVPKQSPDLMVDSVTSNMTVHRLGKYREAAAPLKDHLGSEAPGAVYIQPEKTWTITRNYAEHMRRGLKKDALTNKLLSLVYSSGEIEGLYQTTFSKLYIFQRFFTLVSNLGPFDAHTSQSPQSHAKLSWTIEDIQFSAAAIGSAWSFAAPVFNVAGVRGGDCVINTTIVEGAFTDAAMQKLLDGIQGRLQLLVKLKK